MNWNSGTNFDITCGKCTIKLLLDIVVKIGILETSYMNFRAILILRLIWPSNWQIYHKKTFLDIKIENGIFEISSVPDFNELEHFYFVTNLSLTGDKYLIKVFSTLKSKSLYLKYQMCQTLINSEHFKFWGKFGPNRW